MLYVAPPLLFTVTSFPTTPTNNLAVPSPSLGVVHCNKRDMWNLCKQNFMIVLHQSVLFQLAQHFIHGNSWYRFPKHCNLQICHTHRAFKLTLCMFRAKLRIFPTVKSKPIGLLLHRTQHKLLPEKELPSGLIQEQLAHATLHGACDIIIKRFEICWKCLAEGLLVLHTCVLHHALVERGKDKTVRNSKSLNLW